MSDAYRCDRCNTFVERAFADIVLDVRGKKMYRDYPAEIELCSDCEDEFAEWMDNE